jgi:hypothetical protein
MRTTSVEAAVEWLEHRDLVGPPVDFFQRKDANAFLDGTRKRELK